MSAMRLSVQLYTVRDQAGKDMAKTLREVASIGYKYVELAGFGNLKTAAEMHRALADAGLTVSAAHVGIEALETDLNHILDDHVALGNKMLIVPWMPEARRSSAEGWKQVGQSLTEIARKIKGQGFQLGYHNHDFEFKPVGSTHGMDLLLRAADPELVKAELDVYWLRFAGLDPVAFISVTGSRLFSIHLKDMTAGEKKQFASVGSGVMDFASILSAANRVGAKFGVVEQDDCYGGDSLDSIRRSHQYLSQFQWG